MVAVALILATGCSSSLSAPSRSAAPVIDANPFRIGRPLVIPHGGGDAMYPEDTLFAYEHSIALGGDVVDIDVQTTADGVPIALHDATLQRTTNGSGNVHEMTYAQLAGLDAGWAFQLGGGHPYRGQGIKIPTVRSVLLRFPSTLVTLDLKDLRVDAVAPLCSLLRDLHRTADVYVGVDTDEQVEQFRTLCPEVHTSGTSADRRAMRAAREAGDTTYVTTQLVSQPEYIAPDGTRRITAEFLQFAHQQDMAVLTWVVDDVDDMKRLIDLGVDGIYTRHPDVMVALLRKMGRL